MSGTSENVEERVAQSLDLISRQLDALLKLRLHELQGNRKTIDMIRLLHGMGCRAPDISNWLQAPITSVAPIVSRMRAHQKGRRGRR